MPKYIWGKEWDLDTRRMGERLTVDLNKHPHASMTGPPGCGKGVSNEIPNLLGDGLRDCHVVSVDITGQNYGVTHRWRSTFSDIVRLNPFNLLNYGDDGFNPMLFAKTFEEQTAIGQCLQHVTGQEREPLWVEGAQDFDIGLVGLEDYEAEKKGRTPTLENVYGNLCGDYTAVAKRMVETGIYELATAGGRFLEKNRTTDGIITTAVTSGRWLRNAAIRKSLSVKKGEGFDPMRLVTSERPLSVYVMLDADKVDGPYAGVLKLVVVSIFNTLFRFGTQRKRDTVIMLSEAAALGNLPRLTAALAQGRKYGIRICPMVWQDIGQIDTVFGKAGKTTVLGNSGSLFGFCPAPGDLDTAEFLAKAAGDFLEVSETASEDEGGGNRKSNVKHERQRLWTADETRSLPRFHGLLWTSGRATPQPVACPPYWEIPELKGRYDPDPYHSSPAPAPRPRGPVPLAALASVPTTRRKVIAMGTAAIAGGVWLSNAAGSHKAETVNPPSMRVEDPVKQGSALSEDPPKATSRTRASGKAASHPIRRR